MFDYMSIQDAAEKWNISARRIQKLCEQGRIEGALKFGRPWLIPQNAEKPADKRRKDYKVAKSINMG